MEIRIQGSRWCDLTNNWESQNFLLLFQNFPVNCNSWKFPVIICFYSPQKVCKEGRLVQHPNSGTPLWMFLTPSEFLEKQSVNSFPFGPFQEEYLLLYDSSLHLICCELHFERNSCMKSLCKEEEAFPLK